MIARITGGLDEYIADHSGSVEEFVIALARLGIRVEHQMRPCSCELECGYVLGEVFAGYYVQDVWVWGLVRYQWWPSAAHVLVEAQLDAFERLVRHLARRELVAAGPPFWLP